METDDVLTMLQDVAERVVNPRFRSLSDDQVMSKSHPGDLVTVADREAEVLITRGSARGVPGRRRPRRGGHGGRPHDPGPLPRRRARVHGRPRRRHPQLREGLPRPRRHGGRGARRRGHPQLDLAAAAQGGVRRRARCRSLAQRRAAHPASRRRRPARCHLAPALDRPCPRHAARGSSSRGSAAASTTPRSWRAPPTTPCSASRTPGTTRPGSLLLTEAGGHVGTSEGSALRGPGADPPVARLRSRQGDLRPRPGPGR